jgi:hypothetical protein
MNPSATYAKVVINGHELSQAEEMTLHVAIQSFAMELTSKENPLGGDKHGKSMTTSYLRHINSINCKLLESQPT